jgi:uncharacterized membrane protein YcaP (DUF421 family)
VENGKVRESALRKARISMNELICALHQYEVQNPSELKFAILETNGKITVIKKKEN